MKSEYDPVERAVRRWVRKLMRAQYGRDYDQREYENEVAFQLEYEVPPKLEALLYGEEETTS